jgi:gliding motility-associated-like protein
VTTQTYILTVIRAPAIATLSGILLSSGTLNPGFSTGATSYTAGVSNATTSISITPTASDPGASVKVNGTTVSSGTASPAILLSVGPNAITIAVTGSDGVSMYTYTVTVTRAASSDATLAHLTLSRGVLTPAFAPGTTGYSASVGSTITSITVTATSNDANASIMVNGSPVTSGLPSQSIALNPGANIINVNVTAQDGVTSDSYTIMVYRNASSVVLSGLSVSNGTLSPGFATSNFFYIDTVSNATGRITVTPSVSVPIGGLTVNGIPVTPGTASAPIQLAIGTNTITVVVTAHDGLSSNVYTITVIRPSTDANLYWLNISKGTLSPVFATATTSYTDNVANKILAVTVRPGANPGSTILINGIPVAPKALSQPIPLNVGTNTITVIVTAQDGVTTKTYTITVNRGPSNNTDLDWLNISSGTLSPAFDRGTTAYTDAVTNNVQSVTLRAGFNPIETVTINGAPITSGVLSAPIMLNVGNNTITVAVTAQDGVTTKNYTVTVNRSALSNSATLYWLIPSSGTLSPVFAPGTTSYTDTISNAISSITLKTGFSPGETATVNGTAITSGASSAPIPMNVGPNTIVLVVTAQDGLTTNTYSVIVNRAMAGANSVYQPVSVDKPIDSPQLADDGILVHQGLSPNGDGINDFLVIENIANYPDNKLQIMNRSGQLVFESKNYDNSNKVFDGHSNKTGQMQLPGTYFYSLDYAVNGVTKHKTGFIVLKY